MHITASVFINDDESGLHHDYDEWLDGARTGWLLTIPSVNISIIALAKTTPTRT